MRGMECNADSRREYQLLSYTFGTLPNAAFSHLGFWRVGGFRCIPQSLVLRTYRVSDESQEVSLESSVPRKSSENLLRFGWIFLIDNRVHSFPIGAFSALMKPRVLEVNGPRMAFRY